MEYSLQTIETDLKAVADMLPMPDFKVLRETLAASVEKLHQPMQLAIIGRISSSKSTLVNALLGQKNVAATGRMEVTWNVAWLRYGNPDSDVVIHYKNGTLERKSQSEWAELSVGMLSRRSGESDADYERRLNDIRCNISYIELFHNAEILKQINIIDTPGLDAERSIDSQNTIDFLKKVHPDAVIMLYTKGINNQTVQIVDDYIGQGGKLSPLNSIGIMAKFDMQWDITDKDCDLLQKFRRMTANQFVRYPELKKSLFRIYPLSALMFLGSQTMSDYDFDLLRRLADLDDTVLDERMNTVDLFLDPQWSAGLTVEQRKYLLTEYGRYALYRICKRLKSDRDATIADMCRSLYLDSGADELMTAIRNHFGERAQLIKMESIYQQLIQQCCVCRNSVTATPAILDLVERRINDVFGSLIHEIREYELLGEIYDGKVAYLSAEVVDEFRNLCGENGYSAPERLGIKDMENLTERALLCRAEERWRHWRGEVNRELVYPDRRERKKIIRDSYFNLYEKLRIDFYRLNQLNAFLYNK